MYEILVRSRWFILAFLGVTLASIATYIANGPRGEIPAAGRDMGPPVEITASAAADPDAKKDDGLIDKTVGEDVRPEEEKQAEAAALASASAAAVQARMQPVAAEAGEDQGEE